MEVITWKQVGIHSRGIGMFNVEGYYDGTMACIQLVETEAIEATSSGIQVAAVGD